MKLNEYYRVREILEKLLRQDLHGPVTEDEVISWPDDYYICGRLFPQNTPVSEEETEKNEIADEDYGYELSVSLCYSSRPSSMAISFTVRSGVTKLTAEASFAWYVPEETPPDEATRFGGKRWKRQAKSVKFEIELDRVQPFQATQLHPGLELRIYLQKTYGDGARTLTMAMVNTTKSKMDKESLCASIFFQPQIVVRGTKDDFPVFMEKQLRVRLNQDEELQNMEMLYRHNPTFATGHGCSAGWKASGDYASEVYTEFIPAHEVRQMEPARHVRAEILTFRFLGNSQVQKVCAGLEEMAKSYERWINGQEAMIESLSKRYHRGAGANMRNCRESLQRMRAGIGLLIEDPLVCRAFQLMNLAMLRQREQAAATSFNKHEPGWYPFQLAFILQEISSLACHTDPYRDVVDLLWFPTGGGKTEAYLGLAAFTLFLRRLRTMREHRAGSGVAIIMRYTLRLLTLQQFERAAALICACELIRRENRDVLGDSEIAAGLWVGGGLTPNRREEARLALEKITATKGGFESLAEDEPNPCQVLTCPWCRAEIRPRHYSVTTDKMLIVCPRQECPFHGGLPVYLIDEDIYDHGPALVVGTVDKYARMTWQPDVGKLFGLGTGWQPPELIIQDELHLISGPLGTIAGLYEVAVDEFCQNSGVKAKIISSTATIRNAAGQIRSLYGRESRQFPAQGLDIRDSYFAREAAAEDRPTRRYLGVLAPGTSGDTLLIRVYSVMLMATRYLVELGFSNEAIDSFWTLTGYFNTLKQLGGTVVHILDEVQWRLKFLYETKFSILFPHKTYPPPFLRFDELTSRKKSSEIAEVLKRLETGYPEEDAFDLILASSMLSAGIDIGRLGLMVVQGQPKSNSEYIQATSRVGRKTPGMVITMYDASRSRNRSHYEQFRSYHGSLYRYVEATSLTPFADRARDRALHAVLISLCRHLIAGLRNNGDAGQVPVFRSQVESIIERIVERVSRVDDSEVEATRRELLGILEKWESMAGPNLVYQKYRNQNGFPLLTGRFDTDGAAMSTLNSMRDVDVECHVFLER